MEPGRHTTTAASFTVVVPSRGRHDLVAEVVGTLTNLGCPTVLVDDGSEPPIRMADRELLTLVRQRPQGAGPARNNGVRHATSEWIVFTDSDTMWTPATRDRLRQLMAGTPDRVWVCGETLLPSSVRTVTADWMRRLQDQTRPASRSEDIEMATGLMLCRRQEFIDVGGFLPSMSGSGGEDLELGRRIRSDGLRVWFDPDWNAINCDRPFSFARLMAREKNYARRRQELLSTGIDAADWLLLPPARFRHRLLAPLCSAPAVRTLNRLGELPDASKAAPLVRGLLRAAISANVRRVG